MFHLLVSSNGWADVRDSMPIERIFENTEHRLEKQFKPDGIIDLARLSTLPALFMSETFGTGIQLARLGVITGARITGRDLNLEYAYDAGIAQIPNSTLQRLAGELSIEAFEFSRTHWAIKDVDLFRVLLKHRAASRPIPSVFELNETEEIENDLVSVMMPFDSRFNAVYVTLQRTAEALSLRCLRGDDIWNYDAVIRDLISLINRSRVIICDCTDRNANVFYEAGIAHTLGRHVILITQHRNDIPFNLRHLRYVTYLSNNEGLQQLSLDLAPRLRDLFA